MQNAQILRVVGVLSSFITLSTGSTHSIEPPSSSMSSSECRNSASTRSIYSRSTARTRESTPVTVIESNLLQFPHVGPFVQTKGHENFLTPFTVRILHTSLVLRVLAVPFRRGVVSFQQVTDALEHPVLH